MLFTATFKPALLYSLCHIGSSPIFCNRFIAPTILKYTTPVFVVLFLHASVCYREQWKGHVPAYHPVFMDGWSPDYPVVDEPEDAKNYRDSQNDGHYNSDYNDYEASNQDNLFAYDNRSNEPHRERSLEREPKMEPERDVPQNIRDLSARSDISVDSIERNGGEERSFGRSQESWLDELQTRGANIVQVTYPRTANNDKELTVVRGEFLEVSSNPIKSANVIFTSIIRHLPTKIRQNIAAHTSRIFDVNTTSQLFQHILTYY